MRLLGINPKTGVVEQPPPEPPPVVAQPPQEPVTVAAQVAREPLAEEPAERAVEPRGHKMPRYRRKLQATGGPRFSIEDALVRRVPTFSAYTPTPSQRRAARMARGARKPSLDQLDGNWE